MKKFVARVTLPPPLLLLLLLVLLESPGATFAQGYTSPGRVSDASTVAEDSEPSAVPPEELQCAKANEQKKCNATLHCWGNLPELSPDDGWKTTVLRESDTWGQYFNELFGDPRKRETEPHWYNETLVGVSLSWRFKDKGENLVEFAVRYWAGCNMPHVKIGFPSPLDDDAVGDGSNLGAAMKRRDRLLCDVDFPYVDIEQISSAKYYCPGTGPDGSRSGDT
jgi:hypothetical protein